MFGLRRSLLSAVAVPCLLLSYPGVLGAVTITYGDSNRPVTFEDVEYNATTYTVTVQWNTSYQTAYVLRTPFFWGDEAGATSARDVLSQALVDDGYTTAATQSHLCIPYSYEDPNINNLSISLATGPTTFSVIGIPVSQVTAELGFTLWDQTVPIEASSWGTIKALFH